VVLTGRNRTTGMCEALAHLEILLAAGVPRERIILETQSTNTLENVTLGRAAIAAQIDLADIGAIVAVAKWHHSRRAVMTLKAHMPAGIRYYVRSYEPDAVRRADWHRDPGAVRGVIKEWQAIPRYLARGDIAEIEGDGSAFV
jgi:uncharacterized SAM-binding protein YcdF (DUF218 family)